MVQSLGYWIFKICSTHEKSINISKNCLQEWRDRPAYTQTISLSQHHFLIRNVLIFVRRSFLLVLTTQHVHVYIHSQHINIAIDVNLFVICQLSLPPILINVISIYCLSLMSTWNNSNNNNSSWMRASVGHNLSNSITKFIFVLRHKIIYCMYPLH